MPEPEPEPGAEKAPITRRVVVSAALGLGGEPNSEAGRTVRPSTPTLEVMPRLGARAGPLEEMRPFVLVKWTPWNAVHSKVIGQTTVGRAAAGPEGWRAPVWEDEAFIVSVPPPYGGTVRLEMYDERRTADQQQARPNTFASLSLSLSLQRALLTP